MYFEAILLKRKRIIARRVTFQEPIEPEPNEAETIESDPVASGGRSIFAVGRPNKSFRSITIRRSSAPAPAIQPIELFDVPIIKNNDDSDNGETRIRFDDINFGRLTN